MSEEEEAVAKLATLIYDAARYAQDNGDGYPADFRRVRDEGNAALDVLRERAERAERAERERDEAVAGKYQAPEIELAREEGKWAARYFKAQERAEKAEARLRGHETCECGHTLCQHEPRSFGCADLHGPCALSPTQETDPE